MTQAFCGFSKRRFWYTLFVALCLTGMVHNAIAQKQANVWYFGNNAGLDFNSGAPVALTNSAMVAFEGTASIADENGQLLFYTNGNIVWNKQHQVMRNGTDLLGHGNSAQACLIVQKPGSRHIYYIFTTDANGGPNGLRYSTVDLSREGGLGEITEKNTLIYSPTSEKLTATLHANKRDIWVISHEHGTSNVTSILVDEHRVGNATATSQLIPSDLPPDASPTAAIGCMKISPDGKMLAITHRSSNTVRLFWYNTSSGVMHYPPLPISLVTGEGPYGVEFSPDNSKLYVSTDAGTKITQFDLTSGDAATIATTKKEVAQVILDTNTRYVGNSLQLGPDGKIYVAKAASAHLGVINNPNAAGTACNYVDKGIHLAGRTSGMGLPAIMQSFLAYSEEIKFDLKCFGQESSFLFDAAPGSQPTFMEWDFGDPASGAANKASTLSAKHSFSAPGEYTVTFTRHINNKVEIHSITFIIAAPPTVDLGPERKICPGSSVTLNATTPGATYTWSNGSTAATLTTGTPGNYWVDVTVGKCTTRATVKVSQLPVPVVNLGPDKELCQGETLVLNAASPNATYRWQDGSTEATFKVTGPGIYRVEVTNAEGCASSDEIQIRYNDLPVVNLGPDQTVCANTTVTLTAAQPGVTYKWQDGSTAPNLTVASPGKYWVTLTNSKGCSATDTVLIHHLPIPFVNLGSDTTLCSGETLLLSASFPNATYRWQDGSTAPTFTVKESGKYWVEVTNEFGCTVRDDIWVPYLERPTIFLGNDTTLCYGDTLVVGRKLPGDIRYRWQDGSTEATYAITKPGIYKLSAFNQHCEAADEIKVSFKDCIGGLFIPNILTPNGDGLNDVFFIHGMTEDNWELTIYNRWGAVIQTIKNYRNNWAPPQRAPGIYYYQLRHASTGRTYKGSLEVVY